MDIDRDLWLKEIDSHQELFDQLSDRLPKEMTAIRELLSASLERAPTTESEMVREALVAASIGE
jgi:phosphoenolpyruvate carboxykinase (GTP)